MNPLNLRKYSPTGRVRGAAIVELALIVPLLLLLFFGGAEFAHSLRIYAKLTAVARELVLAEFRGCYARTDHAVCLQSELNQLLPNTNLTISNIRLTATRWQYDSVTNTCQQLASVSGGVTFPPPYSSFNTSQIPSTDPVFVTTCQEQGLLFGSEVFVEHRPLIPGVGALFSFMGGVFRAVVVI